MLNIFNIFTTTSQLSSNFIKLYLQSIQLSENYTDIIFTSYDLITKAHWLLEDSYFESYSISEYFSIKSLDNLTKFFLFKNMKIVKIEYPYLVKNESNIDEGFLYLRMTKFYSINSIPANWRIPFLLLIKYFNLEEYFSVNEMNLDLYHYTIKNSKEYYNPLVELYCQDKENRINDYEMEKSSIPKFSDDEVNPIAHMFNSDSDLKFLYTRNFTYLITKSDELEIEIINNENPSLKIFTTNNASILNYQLRLEDSLKSVEIEKYLQIMISENFARSFKSDLIFEIVMELREIKKNFGKKLNIRNLKDSINIPASINNIYVFDGNVVFHFKVIKDVGEFFAYKNKAIKVKFCDRTILKIDSENKKIWILNKLGQTFTFIVDNLDESFEEFHTYYLHALKFYNFCFLSTSEKETINENLKMIHEMTDTSLKKINSMRVICENELNRYNILNDKPLGFNYHCEYSSYNNYQVINSDPCLIRNEKTIEK